MTERKPSQTPALAEPAATSQNVSSWTPGPWEVGEISTPPFERGVFGRDKMAIAKIYVPLDFNKKRSEANAKLIAKAPEMAKVLQSLLGYLRGWFPDEPLFSAESHSQAQVIADAERILREAGAL